MYTNSSIQIYRIGARCRCVTTETTYHVRNGSHKTVWDPCHNVVTAVREQKTSPLPYTYTYVCTVPIPSTALTLGIVLLFRIGMGIGCVVSWQVALSAVFAWTGSGKSGVHVALRLTEGGDTAVILVGDDAPSVSPTQWIECNRATADTYLKGHLYTTLHTVNRDATVCGRL